MWDSGGCDASYPLTPVSPFASLREEVPLGSLAVSSRGSGVSPLPLRRSLWSEFRVFCAHQRRQRAAHSHSDRSSSATPLSLRLRATHSSCSCCCLYLREDRLEEYEKIAQPGGRAWAEHRAGRHRREASRADVEGHEGSHSVAPQLSVPPSLHRLAAGSESGGVIHLFPRLSCRPCGHAVGGAHGALMCRSSPPRCEHSALAVFPRHGSDGDRSILLERWTGRLFASRRGPSHSSSGPPPRFPCPSAGPLPFKGCDAVAESVSCRSPFPGYELSSPAHLYGNPMA